MHLPAEQSSLLSVCCGPSARLLLVVVIVVTVVVVAVTVIVGVVVAIVVVVLCAKTLSGEEILGKKEAVGKRFLPVTEDRSIQYERRERERQLCVCV